MKINKIIQPAKDFLKTIDGKTVVVHGHDCDSLCSAAIFYKLVKKLSKVKVENVVTKTNYSFSMEDLKTVKKMGPKYVIILDIPEISIEVMTKIVQTSKVLIVDHHKPKGYVRISYVNPMIYEDIYMPTAYISYKIFESFFNPEEILWIACVGTLGDHGVETCTEIFKNISKIRPELVKGSKLNSESMFNSSELGLIARMIDAARIVGVKQVDKAFEILIRAESHEDVKRNAWLQKIYKSVEKEFERIKKDFEKNRKVFGEIVLYEIKSKYNLKSSFAGYAASLFEDKIVCILQKFNENYEVSFRRGRKIEVDLSEFASKIVKGIGYGGGHASAAAAKFPAKSLNLFLEKLKKM